MPYFEKYPENIYVRFSGQGIQTNKSHTTGLEGLEIYELKYCCILTFVS